MTSDTTGTLSRTTGLQLRISSTFTAEEATWIEGLRGYWMAAGHRPSRELTRDEVVHRAVSC